MRNLTARFRSLARDDRGQDLIEYALLASLIAIAVIVGIGDVGTEVGVLWSDIATGLQAAFP